MSCFGRKIPRLDVRPRLSGIATSFSSCLNTPRNDNRFLLDFGPWVLDWILEFETANLKSGIGNLFD